MCMISQDDKFVNECTCWNAKNAVHMRSVFFVFIGSVFALLAYGPWETKKPLY